MGHVWKFLYIGDIADVFEKHIVQRYMLILAINFLSEYI